MTRLGLLPSARRIYLNHPSFMKAFPLFSLVLALSLGAAPNTGLKPVWEGEKQEGFHERGMI